MNRNYIKGIVLLGVVLSMGLSSCQLVNKYKTPELDTAGLYRDLETQDTTTVANIPWKQYFADPYLQGLIEEGIANNYDLQIAVERIKQAEAASFMAKAAYFPSVALAGQVQHNRWSADKATGDNKDVLGYDSNQYSLGLAATWEIDLWGKLNRQARAKYADLLSTKAYRDLIQTTLVANIANAYYSLLTLDEQLKVTKETITLLEKSCETMDALWQSGSLTRAAVSQSKSLLHNTQISVSTIESQIYELENTICLMLGRKGGYISRSNISDQSVPQELHYGVPAQMLAKRPDVLQAEYSFRSAFELTNAARASFYPSITLSTGSMVGYGAASLSKFFRPENLFASIIGGITQPLFAKGQLLANLKASKAGEKAALLTFEKTVLSASNEVANIMFAFESSLKKNEFRTEQVNALIQAVEDTQELLLSGKANYTEVLTAQQNLLQAQLGQTSDKLEQLKSSVNLYRALGGGLE